MNMVNKAYAEAAARRQPELMRFLVAIFSPIYGADTEKRVNEMADFMGRHVKPPVECGYSSSTPPAKEG